MDSKSWVPPIPLPSTPPASLGSVGANHQKCETFLKFLKCELRNRSFSVFSKGVVKFYKIALEVKSTLKKKLYRHQYSNLVSSAFFFFFFGGRSSFSFFPIFSLSPLFSQHIYLQQVQSLFLILILCLSVSCFSPTLWALSSGLESQKMLAKHYYEQRQWR